MHNHTLPAVGPSTWQPRCYDVAPARPSEWLDHHLGPIAQLSGTVRSCVAVAREHPNDYGAAFDDGAYACARALYRLVDGRRVQGWR